MDRQVKHFLLVFDRAHSRLLREVEIKDSRQALVERFRAERRHRASPEIEVVVLSAESREALRLTHSRYFQTVSSLASVWVEEHVGRQASTGKAADLTQQP